MTEKREVNHIGSLGQSMDVEAFSGILADSTEKIWPSHGDSNRRSAVRKG
jgi:hypothetical protein